VDRRVTNPSDLERKFFELDRRIVAGVLNTLRDALHEGAVQLDMVADERMFDKLLSANLSQASRRLDRIRHKLEGILGDVSKATGYPAVTVAPPIKHAEVRQLPARQSKG